MKQFYASVVTPDEKDKRNLHTVQPSRTKQNSVKEEVEFHTKSDLRTPPSTSELEASLF